MCLFYSVLGSVEGQSKAGDIRAADVSLIANLYFPTRDVHKASAVTRKGFPVLPTHARREGAGSTMANAL